jgi:putative RNA 2'-phosphotransferase
MNDMDLSKTMSYALRHHPEQFGLVLDEFGFVDVNALVRAISLNGFKYVDVTIDDITRIVNAPKPGEKKRYEIVGDKIRAYYGHSTGNIKKTPVEPPEVLYHGTTSNAWESIQKTGLDPMGRDFVHLSAETGTAIIVAKRRTNQPVILIVDAKVAYKDGVKFYSEPNNVWLSDPIPVEYIKQL